MEIFLLSAAVLENTVLKIGGITINRSIRATTIPNPRALFFGFSNPVTTICSFSTYSPLEYSVPSLHISTDRVWSSASSSNSRNVALSPGSTSTSPPELLTTCVPSSTLCHSGPILPPTSFAGHDTEYSL